MIKVKNIYELPEVSDGFRVLAERLWPQSLSPESQKVDEWAIELAPSAELESWYSFDPDLWEGFQRKYRNELKHSKRLKDFIEKYKGLSVVTLLFTVSHKTNNPALILQESLEQTFEDNII